MSTTLQRRTPLRKKAAKPRRKLIPRCTKQRCDRYELADGLCFQHLRDVCDMLARDRTREAWGGCCSRCGSFQNVQWSHHLSRRFMWCRYREDGATLHCEKCHTLLTHNPALHTEWIRSFVGEAVYASLMDDAYGPFDPATGRRTGPPKFGDVDLLAWYERLKGEAA